MLPFYIPKYHRTTDSDEPYFSTVWGERLFFGLLFGFLFIGASALAALFVLAIN